MEYCRFCYLGLKLLFKWKGLFSGEEVLRSSTQWRRSRKVHRVPQSCTLLSFQCGAWWCDVIPEITTVVLQWSDVSRRCDSARPSLHGSYLRLKKIPKQTRDMVKRGRGQRSGSGPEEAEKVPEGEVEDGGVPPPVSTPLLSPVGSPEATEVTRWI